MAACESESETMQRVPLVVVLGATGTGKSKLALQLAAKYAGEIISADSMQVYNGLDIITNKVTAAEKAIAPHHLLDCVSPLSRFTVVDFRNRALPIIDDLLCRSKMPVIVGGTNYYIEALLWQVLMAGETEPGDELLFDQDRRQERARAAAPAKRKLSTASANLQNEVGQQVAGAVGKNDGPTVETIPGPGSGKNDEDKEAPPAPKLARQERAIKCQAIENADFSQDSSGLMPLPEAQPAPAAAQSTEEVELLVQRLRTKDLIVSPDGEELESFSSPRLHALLRHIDPDSAATLHPNNRRKIIRSLQVWQQHGQTHSQLLLQQREQNGGSQLGGPLRYSRSVIFWVQCQQDVLEARLDARVDEMIERGLLEELEEFHRLYNAERLRQQKEPDYSKGIFQSIGFKEFHKYLLMPPSERESTEGQKLFREGVENLKLVTRRYARKQLKWIRNRFLRQPDRQMPPVFGLDATDPSHWHQKVETIAYSVIDAILENKDTPVAPLPVVEGQRVEQTVMECKMCHVTVVGSKQWQEHIRSRKHQKHKRPEKDS